MRLITALLLSAMLVSPTLAQEAEPTPHFRFGFTGVQFENAVPNPDEDTTTDPDDDTNPDDEVEVSELNYATARPAYGSSVTVQPTWDSGVTGFEYSWYYEPEHNYATLNEQTGAVTWSGGFQGDQSVAVYATTDEFGFGGAVGISRASVPRDYEIAFVPGDVTIQWGRLGAAPLQFDAVPTPAQPTAGENWDFVITSDSNWTEPQFAGNHLTFDASGLLEMGELSDGKYGIKAVRTAGGVKVYSDPLTITVTPGPYFGFNSGSSTNHTATGEGPSAQIQVRNGQAINFQAAPKLGAYNTVPTENVPAFLENAISGRNNLPPGLTMSSTGRVTGTVNAESDVTYNVVVPAVNAAGNTYGSSFVQFIIVDDLVPWDEIYDVQRPDRNDPHQDNILPGGGVEPEEPWTPTTYRVVAVANTVTNFQDDYLLGSDSGFEELGYQIILETTDWNAALDAMADREFKVEYSKIIATEDTSLPMEEWYIPHFYDLVRTHNPYLVSFGRNASNRPEASCSPYRMVHIASFSREKFARDYIDWQRSLQSDGTFSGSAIISYSPNYDGEVLERIDCWTN